MERIARADADTVRGMIAAQYLSGAAIDARLGAITLRPHQVDAARRVRALFIEHGGALLCDEVGLGKTYVALAVARTYARTLVVSPASLRGMWQAAADSAGIAIHFTSTESLSRRGEEVAAHDLTIVDEAHHFRTPSTARYGRLCRLCARSPVLLMSATPVHNTRADVTTLLALFLGSAARAMSDRAISSLLVRRGPEAVDTRFPAVRRAVHVRVPCDEARLRQLLALPPPIPPRDGGIAAALVAQNLVRLWASSDAALREGLRRRLARTIAIRAALEAGRYPTRAELGAWEYADGALQLGFAELLSLGAPSVSEELAAINAHEAALLDVVARIPNSSTTDAARVGELRAIRARHTSARVIAFSRFTETVSMYFRGLVRDGGVAMLTARGARIATGAITRREALERFAPRAQQMKSPRRAENITLLVATDLLSEGVNLQDASVVVHLDLPWTAASLDQRIGRAARLNSSNHTVFVYCFDPPASSEELLRAEAIIRAKAALADASVGSSRIPALFAQPPREPSSVEDAESIRRILHSWIPRCPDTGGRAADAGDSPAIATIAAPRDGMLALLSVRGELVLVAAAGGRLSADARAVRETLEIAHGPPTANERGHADSMLERLHGWINTTLAAGDAGSRPAGRSLLAGRISNRLASILTACPHHERTICSARIAALHARMQSPFTLGVEREIEELLKAAPSDLLSQLERTIGAPAGGNAEGITGIRAVLVLQRGDIGG